MPETLLQTKLNIPSPRTDLVPRSRLIERLNHGLQRGCRLTLVAAPAGYGKTTLVLDWLRTSPEMGLANYIAWLSLDDGDNDPTRFFTYFVTTLQKLPLFDNTGMGESALMALHDARPPDIELFLTSLINDLLRVAGTFILVLDDYHLITNPVINKALSFLVDHQPPHMHLVITTRADPALPISRLRGRAQLNELRADDLRFTPEETAAFFSSVMGLELSAQDLATLEANTEGWIAGLQLAALSMQGETDLTTFVQSFTGRQEYIADFLTDEVLKKQPDHVRTFLLQTSILDRLSGNLCDAITGRSDGQHMLLRLKRSNLFLSSIDQEQRWYRYHRLFADVLRNRLRQAWPDALDDLHRRAGLWFEKNGFMDEAIKHALAAEDADWAADLVEQAAEWAMMRGEVTTLKNWITALPEETGRTRAQISVYYAAALLLTGGPLEAIEQYLQYAAGDDADSVTGQVLAVRSWLSAHKGDATNSEESARQALALLPGDSHFWRSMVAANLGVSRMWQGDLDAGVRALEHAARVGKDSGNAWLVVLAMRRLAKMKALQGRLHEAKALLEQALEVAVDGRGRLLPVAGILMMELADLWLEWHELETAMRCLDEGFNLVARWGEIGALGGYITLAHISQAQGNETGALQAIQKAEQLAQKTETTEIDDMGVALHQARLFIAQGNLNEAIRWAETRRLAPADNDVTQWAFRDTWRDHRLRKYEYLVLAELMMAQDQFENALTLLDRLLSAAADEGWSDMVIKIQSLRALAFQGLSDDPQALKAIGQALSLAEPGGYVRHFIEKGQPMARLLYRAAAEGIAPAYTGQILSAFPLTDQSLYIEEATPEWLEPLSPRELQVLQHVAAGASNPEIARDLVISVNTVKKHVGHIFGKLGVTSRTQAVARARDLGMIE